MERTFSKSFIAALKKPDADNSAAGNLERRLPAAPRGHALGWGVGHGSAKSDMASLDVTRNYSVYFAEISQRTELFEQSELQQQRHGVRITGARCVRLKARCEAVWPRATRDLWC